MLPKGGCARRAASQRSLPFVQQLAGTCPGDWQSPRCRSCAQGDLEAGEADTESREWAGPASSAGGAWGPWGGADRDRGRPEEGVPAVMSCPPRWEAVGLKVWPPELYIRAQVHPAVAASSGGLKPGPTLTAFTCVFPFPAPRPLAVV